MKKNSQIGLLHVVLLVGLLVGTIGNANGYVFLSLNLNTKLIQEEHGPVTGRHVDKVRVDTIQLPTLPLPGVLVTFEGHVEGLVTITNLAQVMHQSNEDECILLVLSRGKGVGQRNERLGDTKTVIAQSAWETSVVFLTTGGWGGEELTTNLGEHLVKLVLQRNVLDTIDELSDKFGVFQYLSLRQRRHTYFLLSF